MKFQNGYTWDSVLRLTDRHDHVREGRQYEIKGRKKLCEFCDGSTIKTQKKITKEKKKKAKKAKKKKKKTGIFFKLAKSVVKIAKKSMFALAKWHFKVRETNSFRL